ncbi:MAG: serine/threonine-protein kinase [Myxococcota bacterium]
MSAHSEAGWSGPEPAPRRRGNDAGITTAPERVRPPPGTQLPSSERYRWRDELGRGGMGTVHAVFDARLGREVALKLLARGDRRAAARVAREAEVAARLEHPAIVPVYDAGETPGGQAFFTMRLVRGRSLALALAEATDLPARLALLRPLLTVAEAIAYAHSRGVVHRDLKPANVMLGAFGEVQVVDWGLAAVTGEADAFAGVGVGTRGFAAPEQLAGSATAHAAADVHGLGAILRALIAEVAAPEDLRAIADKACARAPADRYATPERFAEDLRRFLDGQPVKARNYTSWDLAARFVRAYRRLLGIALLALLAGAVVFALAYGRLDDARSRAERAERHTRAALAEQSETYGWALERQALEALASGAAAEAEILSAHALANRDSPRTRGILMRAHAGPRLEVTRSRAVASCDRVFFGHDAYVCAREGQMHFYGDGEPVPRWSVRQDASEVAVGSREVLFLASSGASLRSRATGEELALLRGLYPTNGARVSPSGELSAKFGPVLVARGADGMVRRYAPCRTGRATALALGDTRVAGACAEGQVAIVERDRVGADPGPGSRAESDAQATQTIATPFGQPGGLGPIFSLAFDGGATRLALGGVGGHLAVLDLVTGELEGPWKLSDRALARVEFLGPRHLLVSTDGDAGLVFDTATGLVRVTFPERLSGRLRAGPAGPHASVGADRWAWSLPDDAPPATLTAPAGLSSAAYERRGRWVALARGDGAVSIRDLAQGTLLGEVTLGDAVVKRVAASRDGAHLMAATAADPGFHAIDLRAMSVRPAEGVDDLLALKRIVSWDSPTGERFVASPYREGLYIFDDAHFDAQLAAPAFLDLAASPDRRRVVGLGQHGEVRELSGDRRLLRRGRRAFAVALAVSNAGELAFAFRGRIRWDQADGTVREWPMDLTPLDLAFDAEGRRLAVGSREGAVALYDRDGRLLALVQDGQDRVPWVGFAPDSRLGAACWDGALRFYDPGVLERSPAELVDAAERAWSLDLAEVLRPRD